MSNDMEQEIRPLAVVTGSSNGIGRAIAGHLAKHGWRVHGVDRLMPVWNHANFTASQADLTDRSAIDRFAATVQDPGALVHAAGVLRMGALGR